MKRYAAAIFAVLALLVFAAPSYAHPHVWADVRVRVQFDDEGRVSGLLQSWLFDDFYSTFVISGADMDGDGKPDQKALDAVLAENLSSLAAYGYFTHILSGEVTVATGDAKDGETRVRGKRLEISFLLPVVEPVSAADLPLRYAVYDPTYYIEMVHAESDDAIILDNAPAKCSADLRQPNPDPEQVMLAASLDRTETAGNSLGQYFAEEVLVTCG